MLNNSDPKVSCMKRKVVGGLFLVVMAFESFATSPNLVVNGDFTQGVTGFSSEYVLFPNTTGYGLCQTILGEGCFVIGTNPHSYNPAWLDFPSKNGAGDPFFIANGSQDSSFVWQETIKVTPDANYRFNVWIAANYADPAPSNLKIEFAALASGETCADAVSLVKIGSVHADALNPGTWVEKKTGVRSPSDTVCIRITNAQNAVVGNDFSLDDIGLALDPLAPYARPAVVLYSKTALAAAQQSGAEPVEIHVLKYVTAGAEPVDPLSLDLDLAKDGPQTSYYEAGVGEFRIIPDDGSYAIAFYPEGRFTSGLAKVSYQVSSISGAPSNVEVAEVYVCDINCDRDHVEDEGDKKDANKPDDANHSASEHQAPIAPIISSAQPDSNQIQISGAVVQDRALTKKEIQVALKAEKAEKVTARRRELAARKAQLRALKKAKHQ